MILSLNNLTTTFELSALSFMLYAMRYAILRKGLFFSKKFTNCKK